MILMTFTVPCYNSASYMETCIESLLPAGDDTEIIIIDDGSRDATGEIADRYAEQYPDRVRVIHQENGGHGEGVNQGIRHARGKYFKVVDSDDWLDRDALRALTARMRELEARGQEVDMYVCNYVYEHAADNTRYVMNYRRNFPIEQVCGWKDVRRFGPTQYLMMHSVYFRTQILRDCGVVLPKHTFYVDNLFMYKPLPYVRTIYYMPLDLYRYFIGRVDQSITLENCARRVDQQIRVTKLMVHAIDLRAMRGENIRLYRYLYHELGVMFILCHVFTYADPTPERLENLKALWRYVRTHDGWLYRRMRWGSHATFVCLPGHLGRKTVMLGYRFFKKIVKFG